MILQLTKEQREAIGKENNDGIQIVDSETQQVYVLLRSEVYERLKSLLALDEENQFASEVYSQVMEVFGREGWDDPSMDVYNELDPRRQK